MSEPAQRAVPYYCPFCASEDLVTLALQCATHWDALAHCSYGGVIYNGYPASSITDEGAALCGIHRLATVVAREVLSRDGPSTEDGLRMAPRREFIPKRHQRNPFPVPSPPPTV